MPDRSPHLQKNGWPPPSTRSRSVQMRAHRFVDLGRPARSRHLTPAMPRSPH
jgi:hypothetical protein